MGAAFGAVAAYIFGPSRATTFDSRYQSRWDRAIAEGKEAESKKKAELEAGTGRDEATPHPWTRGLIHRSGPALRDAWQRRLLRVIAVIRLRSALAGGTEVGAALAENRAADRRPASEAGLAAAAEDLELFLKAALCSRRGPRSSEPNCPAPRFPPAGHPVKPSKDVLFHRGSVSPRRDGGSMPARNRDSSA